MKKILNTLLALSVVAGISSQVTAQTRDQIRIVGSSTVFPFATAVAEEFGRSGSFKTPIVESTGSGGGLKLFCSGVGLSHPDITNASRRIKSTEVALCAKNGVTDVTEVKIGFDGIVLANAKGAHQFKLSLKDIYLALAKEVPAPGTQGGTSNLIANPYITWDQINAELPNVKIKVMGPPPTSGTRDAFNELAIEAGCKAFAGNAALKKSDKALYKQKCRSIREDGAYVEEGENDNLIVQKLQADTDVLGVFGFSFLDQNSDSVQGSLIAKKGTDFKEPTFENISSGAYPVSRSLFFYVKKKHVGVVPGIAEYLAAFTNEDAWGDEGYLTDRGLIPLPESERRVIAKNTKMLVNLSLK
ncbi:substrate-binding domain-containing protein [Temperatibacter marinus]|uniref:Substrate-binding domain-containing protein n=1 Tax=Temperatibacter marinus TaxID=1456591 RepID=A0AA52H9R6_9PROT|nr:substrate-binding domain-containing protein [Temperatibacter marinus]WND03471.1 substrate-binding domain-containing protein [Temperatibacter marinus]